MAALIEVANFSKTSSGVCALSDVRFELMLGDVHALMDENGAGKSTLMQIFAGVNSKDSGRILYNGQEVAFADPREAQYAGVGIIHQELQLMNHLTVAQGIFVGREPRRAFGLLLDEDKLNRAVAALLAYLNLTIDPRTVVGNLTVAKQQMVEIAKSFSHNSRVLIMDKPTAALNNAEIAELFKALLRELANQGKAIVVISSELPESLRMSDRIVVMSEGRITGELMPEEATQERIMQLATQREKMAT
ncbi:MAG: ATP-binding cassette domain-containing protein [Roseiarcus sp.]|jgi:ribose transport system ATP-binding protein